MPGITTARSNRRRRFAIVGVLIAIGLAIAIAALLRWKIDPAIPNAKPVASSPAAVPAGFPEYSSPSRAEVSEEQAATAIAVNAATPNVPDQILPARPFAFAPDTLPEDRLRARDCLAAAIHYEAAVESTQGQRAVAQVVLNRVRNPAFPRTVCDVVFQGASRTTGCQFTFTCDGALARRPNPVAWRRALMIADDALAGVVEPSVGTATHYHANWVIPYWRTTLVKLATVGTHIFYRWQGSLGSRAAFVRSYSGGETAYPQLAAAVGADMPLPVVDIPTMTLPQETASSSAQTPLPPRQPLQADIQQHRLAADEQSGTLIDKGRKIGTDR